MHNTKVEVIQNDNITVKERIIRFFEKRIDRPTAEKLYDAAEQKGFEGGTELFDKAIDIICDGLDLDSNELALEITKHQSSNS